MDGNGKIDSYELICALSMLSHSTLEVKIPSSIKYVLTGKSGVDLQSIRL
jgi:hypothetical protein